MMKISFTQIYVELNTSFDLSGGLLQLLAGQLNLLKKEISALQKKFEGKDFTLAFIITATRQSDDVQVKGPTWVRRMSRVEFAVYVPAREFSIFEEKIEYVLAKLAQGVIATFERYGSDSVGMQDVFAKVAVEARGNPALYRSKQDSLPMLKA